MTLNRIDETIIFIKEGINGIPYSNFQSIPSFNVQGHRGRLAFGKLEGKKVVVMKGILREVKL